MGRSVVHFEIGCRDQEKTSEFYSRLFDWKIEQHGPASMIDTKGAGINGHITSLGHDPHNYVIVYVEVDDLNKTIKDAEQLGAKLLVPPVTIPTGSFAWIADPEGNTIGLWKNK